MAETYPKRPKFFAHRVTRLLFKTCMAAETSPTAALLVVFVAHTEDAKHYTAAPTFFNDQLCRVLGTNRWHTLEIARRAAINAGWLHYEAGGTHKPGRYWTLIPTQFAEIDDCPTDEGYDRMQEAAFQNDTLSTESVDTNGRLSTESVDKGVDKGVDHSTLLLSLSRESEPPSRRPGVFTSQLQPPYHTAEVAEAINRWIAWQRTPPPGPNRGCFDPDTIAMDLIRSVATPEELVYSIRYAVMHECKNFRNYAAEHMLQSKNGNGYHSGKDESDEKPDLKSYAN